MHCPSSGSNALACLFVVQRVEADRGVAAFRLMKLPRQNHRYLTAHPPHVRRAPHELDARKQQRDKEAADKRAVKAAARAEAKAATESAMVPFDAGAPTTRSAGESTRTTTTAVSTVALDATTAESSTQQGKGDLEESDGGSKGGGVSSREESGSLIPTLVSSITTATEDLPANVVASG